MNLLTGLAQRRVVRMTPIRGVTVIIFTVNLGKNSLARTVTQYITKTLVPDES